MSPFCYVCVRFRDFPLRSPPSFACLACFLAQTLAQSCAIELFRKASKVIRNRGSYWQVKVYAGLDPAVSAAFGSVKRLFRSFGGGGAHQAVTNGHLHKRR